MKKFLAVTVAVASLSTLAIADGLEVGQSVGAFYVKDVTGPRAGEKLCYRCNYGAAPVVSIFARDVNADVAALIKEIDGVVEKNQEKKMKGFVVLLTDEPEAKEGELKKVADEKHVSNVPLTTFDGIAGPPAYKLAQDAQVTVMMWVDGKLMVNEAFKAGEFTQSKIPEVVLETKKILN